MRPSAFNDEPYEPFVPLVPAKRPEKDRARSSRVFIRGGFSKDHLHWITPKMVAVEYSRRGREEKIVFKRKRGKRRIGQRFSAKRAAAAGAISRMDNGRSSQKKNAIFETSVFT